MVRWLILQAALVGIVDCAPLTGEKIREFEGGAIGSTSG